MKADKLAVINCVIAAILFFLAGYLAGFSASVDASLRSALYHQKQVQQGYEDTNQNSK